MDATPQAVGRAGEALIWNLAPELVRIDVANGSTLSSVPGSLGAIEQLRMLTGRVGTVFRSHAMTEGRKIGERQFYNEGVEAGRKWASGLSIDHPHIKALGSFVQCHSSDLDRFFNEAEPGRRFAEALTSTDRRAPQADEFWKEAIGEDVPFWWNRFRDSGFLRGFCDGAYSVSR